MKPTYSDRFTRLLHESNAAMDASGCPGMFSGLFRQMAIATLAIAAVCLYLGETLWFAGLPFLLVFLYGVVGIIFTAHMGAHMAQIDACVQAKREQEAKKMNKD